MVPTSSLFLMWIKVILHIKLKEMKGTTTCKQILFPLHTPSTPGQNFFSESSHVAFQTKGNYAQNNMLFELFHIIVCLCSMQTVSTIK